MEPNRRLALLRLLERAAALLRRVGLGGLVDRARAPALSALGEFTQQVGGVVLSGDTALHSHYVRQLQEKDREGATMRAFSEAVRDGAVVLDIGAHLGYFTVLAAKRGATVLAFEPNPRTIAHLRRNLALNGVTDHVRVVQRAVGGEPGTASFFLSRGGDESSLHAHSPEDEPVTVEVVPVDAETDGLRVDVIKMDVEGGEVEALRGMRRTLADASPGLALFVERNSDALGRAGHSPGDLDDALRSLGLELEVLDQDDESGYVNLVCRRA